MLTRMLVALVLLVLSVVAMVTLPLWQGLIAGYFCCSSVFSIQLTR